MSAAGMGFQRTPLRIVGAAIVAAGLCAGAWYGVQQLRKPPTSGEPRTDQHANQQADTPKQPAQPADAVQKADSPKQRTEPPELDLTDVDYAVVELIRTSEAAVRQKPDSAAAWGKLGMVLLAHEFNEQAAECFVQAAKVQPREPRWPYLQGLSVIRLQPDAALRLLTQAVELCPAKTLEPRLRLFELYLELDRPDDVEGLLRRFLAEHPENSRARLAMARLALRRGRLEECLREIELIGKERAGLKPLHELRAEVYNRQGRKEDAETERRLAAGAPAVRWPDPFHDEALRLRTGLKLLLSNADRLYVQGRSAESIAELEKAVEQYPKSEWAWIMLGRAQIRLRRLSEAEQSLGKVLAINPDSADAQFRMGVLYSLTGKQAEAIGWFQKVLAQKADHPVALYNLAMCLQQTGEKDRALEFFRKAINCQPDYFDAHRALGDLLAKDGQTDAARKILQRAAELRPDDSWVRQRLEQLPKLK